jgi:hypothetical protein
MRGFSRRNKSVIGAVTCVAGMVLIGQGLDIGLKGATTGTSLSLGPAQLTFATLGSLVAFFGTALASFGYRRLLIQERP